MTPEAIWLKFKNDDPSYLLNSGCEAKPLWVEKEQP
jgi:hypothetical protein